MAGGASPTALSAAVYSAKIQTNGSLSTWVTEKSLSDAIYTHRGVANGMLYVLGGVINDGTEMINSVNCSRINPDGTLAGWNRTTPLPQMLSNFGAVTAGGRIFVMLGYNGI